MSKPKALFIFGGTGDLARKKLFPALARIAKRRDDLKMVYSIARSKRENWECIAHNLDAGFDKLYHFIPQNFLSISFELRPPTGRFIACPVETTMKYDLEEALGQPLPEAYETLLEDILDSDQSLFIRADEIEVMWEKVEPLISSEDTPRVYPRGKLPDFAIEFIQKDGRSWFL